MKDKIIGLCLGVFSLILMTGCFSGAPKPTSINMPQESYSTTHIQLEDVLNYTINKKLKEYKIEDVLYSDITHTIYVPTYKSGKINIHMKYQYKITSNNRLEGKNISYSMHGRKRNIVSLTPLNVFESERNNFKKACALINETLKEDITKEYIAYKNDFNHPLNFVK